MLSDERERLIRRVESLKKASGVHERRHGEDGDHGGNCYTRSIDHEYRQHRLIGEIGRVMGS
jgi:hypothetical protein